MAKSTAKQSAKRAGSAAASARSNPYVRRLIEDEDLRENLRGAFDAAQHAYKRLSNGKGPAKAIQDKKVQRDLKTAAESLREASEQLRGRPKRKRRGRAVFALLVGAGVALAVSESARKKVLDTLFGSEEEFEYTSTTAPVPEPAETTTA